MEKYMQYMQKTVRSDNLIYGFILSVACVLWALPIFAQENAQAIGKVYVVTGNVAAHNADGTKALLRPQDPIFQNQRIVTGPQGRVQLKFADDSLFTIGKNAQIVIDTYVYDPATNSGTSIIETTKGLFKFVTGKIAKKDPQNVKINTPFATIGVRGSGGIISVAPSGATTLGVTQCCLDLSPRGASGTSSVALNEVGTISTVNSPDTPATPPAPAPEGMMETWQADIAIEGAAETPNEAPAPQQPTKQEAQKKDEPAQNTAEKKEGSRTQQAQAGTPAPAPRQAQLDAPALPATDEGPAPLDGTVPEAPTAGVDDTLGGLATNETQTDEILRDEVLENVGLSQVARTLLADDFTTLRAASNVDARTHTVMKGFVAGFVKSVDQTTGDASFKKFMGDTAGDSAVTIAKPGGSLNTGFLLKDDSAQSLSVSFSSAQKPQDYVFDDVYRQENAQTGTYNGTALTDEKGFLVTGNGLLPNAQGLPTQVVNFPTCTSCQFAHWGIWAGEFDSHTSTTNVKDYVEFMPYIAGERTGATHLTALQVGNVTGTYSGNIIGSKVSDYGTSAPIIEHTTGTFEAGVDFGNRKVTSFEGQFAGFTFDKTTNATIDATKSTFGIDLYGNVGDVISTHGGTGTDVTGSVDGAFFGNQGVPDMGGQVEFKDMSGTGTVATGVFLGPGQ